MSAYKPPRSFFKPLAIGALEPFRELPVRVERMIHFVPPHLEKVRNKTPDMAKKVDVILANLEDAIPSDAKEAARAGALTAAVVVRDDVILAVGRIATGAEPGDR